MLGNLLPGGGLHLQSAPQTKSMWPFEYFTSMQLTFKSIVLLITHNKKSEITGDFEVMQSPDNKCYFGLLQKKLHMIEIFALNIEKSQSYYYFIKLLFFTPMWTLIFKNGLQAEIKRHLLAV